MRYSALIHEPDPPIARWGMIHLFAEGDTVELVERGLVEPFTNGVRLRAPGLALE
jgi:hypothetical protein